MTDLKKVYEEQIKPKLKEDLGLSNVMQVPRITQITLNTVSYTHLTLPTILRV